jgi:hypothetical protein
MMTMRPKRKLDPAKLRRRREPPSLEEAIFAAQGLTADRSQQVSLAAQLIGLPEEEVRPAVLKAGAPRNGTAVRIAGARRPVIVGRRARPPVGWRGPA